MILKLSLTLDIFGQPWIHLLDIDILRNGYLHSDNRTNCSFAGYFEIPHNEFW